MFKLNLKMAWLNVWRRKIRSLLVILMIGVSMSVMLAIQGLYDGMTRHMIESSLRSETGEISLFALSYRLHQNLAYRLKETHRIIEEMENMPEVISVVQRIRVTGLASTARKSTLAKLVGIDIERENQFGGLETFVVDGAMTFGDNDEGAVIGKKLAQDLNLEVGERVIFSAQDSHGELSAISLRIKGLVRTTNMTIDDLAIFVSQEKSRAITALEKNESTEIALRLKEGEDIGLFQSKLEKKWPGLEIYSWKELYPALEQMQVMTNVFNGITFAIVMMMVFIGILGVMFVSILERIREFGILLAIGEPYRFLRTQVIYEALILGVGGYIFGVVAGSSALLYLQSYGLDLSRFSAGLAEFGMASILYAAIKFHYFTTTFAAIVLAGLLSVVFPLRRLKILNPIEVIQGD